MEKNILPALSEERVVLMDRYYYSTAAYQGALGLDSDKILSDNERFAPIPDRAYIFTAPPEQCLQRIEESRDGCSSFEKLDYLIKVQKKFNSFDGSHIKKINSIYSIEDIHTQLCVDIQKLIGI